MSTDATPEPLLRESIDFEAVVAACDEYIQALGSDDYHDDRRASYKSHIAETAIQAIYGSEIWSWVNERLG